LGFEWDVPEMKIAGRPLYRVAMLAMAFFGAVHSLTGLQPGAAPAVRIRSRIDNSQIFRLQGHIRPLVAQGLARDEGALPGWQEMPRLSIHFKMTDAQRADLEQLLAAQQNRRSPQYRKFLTPEEYGARFGLNATDLQNVTEWLERSGFRDLQPARGRSWISFSGTVSHVESAFHTSIRKYSWQGEMHFANATNPALPKALEGMVEEIAGLHDFLVKPYIVKLRPQYTTSSYPYHFVAPDDWQTIYDVKPLYGIGIDGTTASIAIIGQSNVQMSDIQAFRSAGGLPAKTPTVVTPTGYPAPGPPTGSSDEIESDLDLEWAGAVAKNADIIFVTTSKTGANGVRDSLQYAIDAVISVSYGECEAVASSAFLDSETQLFQQANAQGITIVVSSGDRGAATCESYTSSSATHGLNVDFPASSPYVTGVGGTEFEYSDASYWNLSNNGNGGSALSYIPELAWNDGYLFSSGGGASKVFSKPPWQVGLGVPNDGQRDVPDVAFTASVSQDPVLICQRGSCANGSFGSLAVGGGTSASAPAFAGILALAVQATGGRLGNINPNLYSLAQVSENAFHDVTLLNNYTDCQAGSPDCPASGRFGYAAGPGYDQVTGWGSVDAYNFVEQWSGDIQLTANPSSLTIQPGASATATIDVTAQNNFKGTVSFTCSVSSSLIDVSCSVPGTVNTSGSIPVTITAASTARAPWLRRLPPPQGLVLIFIGLALAMFALRKRRPVYAATVACFFAMAVAAVSCGGGSSGGSSPPSYAALVLSCSVPPATLNTPYSSGLCNASGGNSVYSYSVTYGNYLPSGLSLNSMTGAITGTPTYSGAQDSSVTVTDTESPPQSATQRFTLLVNNDQPLGFSCPPVLNTNVGVSVHDPCSTSGGTPPVGYSISAGALPAGLSVDLSGTITGTPKVTGTGSFTVKASDGGSPQQSAASAVSFNVNPALPLTVNCFDLGRQAHVSGFTSACVASGGLAPMRFTLAAGALPPGLTLDSSSGVISGTPSAAGTYSFTLSVTDSDSPAQTTTGTFTFVILPPPPESGIVTVTATSGGVVNTVDIAVTVPSPTANTSSTIKISGSRCAATPNASRTYIPEEYRLTGVSRNFSTSANATISSNLRLISARDIPRIAPFK